MNALLVMPIVIPLATAALSLAFWSRQRVRRWLGVGGAAALLVAAVLLLAAVRQRGILATQIGDWPAPYGISLVADLLAAIMVVLTGVIGLATAVFSLGSIDRRREAFGYYPLLSVLLAGVCGTFLTGDLFNLYVWFEVLLVASFALLTLGGRRPQVEGAIKYVTINLVSSAVFLTAVGIVYGVTGTLNMADLHVKLQTVPPWLVTALAMLFLVAFGVKAAVFPLFFWLPASYHTPPAAVSAVFAGLLTKVGVYALIRVFTLLFTVNPGFTYSLILWIAGLTMITGVLGAMAQNDFRRILSFHIVSQIGYMVMGLGLFGLAASPTTAALALAASIFYITHHIIVKTNLFLVSGVVERLRGTSDLKALGGLYDSHPILALLFAIPAFSLAGVPPLSGFFAKLALIVTGFQAGQHAIVAVALAVGLCTLISMSKIWTEVFWKPAPERGPAANDRTFDSSAAYRARLAPVAVLALLTILIGLAAGPVFALALEAARQLQDPAGYVHAVGLERL